MAEVDLRLFVWIWLDDGENPFKHVLPVNTPRLEVVAAIECFYGHLGVKSFEVELAASDAYDDETEEEEDEEVEVPDVQEQLAAQIEKDKPSAFPKRKAAVKK